MLGSMSKYDWAQIQTALDACPKLCVIGWFQESQESFWSNLIIAISSFPNIHHIHAYSHIYSRNTTGLNGGGSDDANAY